MLYRKKADCFGFGAAFAYLANAVGYKAYAVSSGGHGWAEVNGRVYDPDWAKVTGKIELYGGMNYNVTGPGIPRYKGNRLYVKKYKYDKEHSCGSCYFRRNVLKFVDLNKLGGVVTKGVANVPWPGNPTPRVTETASGMLNAIGLQNPGIDLFCKRDIPFLKQYDTKIIVNVCGKSTEDYCEVVERLADEPAVSVGTANFFNPYATVEIAEGIEKFMAQQKVEDINQLIGIVK